MKNTAFEEPVQQTSTPATEAEIVRISDLLGVKRRYEEAGVALVEATKKAFPIGSVVAVTMGRARIVGEVVSAGGCWWYHPSEVRIRNLSTGKMRHFSATYEGHEIEFLTPNGAGSADRGPSADRTKDIHQPEA